MTLRTIPLNQLVASNTNVRKTGKCEGLAELAASIKAHGLLQNLQVKAHGKKFEVLAGGRRLAALQRLAGEKEIAANFPVPCQVYDGDDATEISLAENVVRLDMHPADQFEAFKKLSDEGHSDEDIAARFGITPKLVKQRLKLACVSPKLMALYRKGEMQLDQLMAFTVVDDHDAQEQAWFDAAAYHRDADDIRAALMQQHVQTDDKRVQFIGLAAYTKAGGEIVRDLFDDANGGWLTDQALLNRLVAEKLEKLAAKERAGGWKWVEVMPDLDHDQLHRMGRVSPRLSAADQKKRDQLEQQLNHAADDDDQDRHDALYEKIDALDEKADFTAEDKALAGVIVSIDHEGEPAIKRGLVKPEDQKLVREQAEAEAANEEGAEPPLAPGLSAKLVANLTAHLTAALSLEIALNPSAALVAVVHALAIDVLYEGHHAKAIEIKATVPYLDRHAEEWGLSTAGRQISVHRESWSIRLPQEPEKLWNWLLTQEQSTLLELLALCVGGTVNALHLPKQGEPQSPDVGLLARAVNLDMRKYWQPTKDSYFAQVPKALILEAVSAARSPQAAEKLQRGCSKKDALIAAAEKELSDSGWLPAILRSHEAT